MPKNRVYKSCGVWFARVYHHSGTGELIGFHEQGFTEWRAALRYALPLVLKRHA